MNVEFRPPKRSWPRKFCDAFRGFYLGIRGQNSFAVHFVVTVAVVVTATLLQVRFVGWCLLLLCIAMVLTAEMFNSALERLAKAIDACENPHLADGLNVGSAAVLMASIGAVVVGGMVLARRIGAMLQWW